MKRKLLLLMTVALMATSVQAAQVTEAQAMDVARHFVNGGTSKLKATPGAKLTLAHAAKSSDGKADYYVFNRGTGDGFIVVSGEDRVQPVWGYCDQGTFDYDKMPSNVKWWFSEYQRQMQYLREHPQARARKAVNLTTSVEPLLTTKWNQCRPYNDYCPVAASDNDPYWIYGGRACTGCVATALAQVMNYYKWPAHGVGSKSYDFDLTTCNGTQSMTLSADFSQSTYQWDLMKDEYLYMDKNNYGYFDDQWHIYIKVIDENGDTITDPNGIHGNAVARLISDVGIAVEMMYGYNGSGAYTYDAYYALRDNFKYQVGYAYRDEYNGDFDELMRGWLDYHFPLYFSGQASGGHAFVLDGYDNQGRFHVNWGWGGVYNGYFESLALDPDGTGGYNSYQQVIASEPNRPFVTDPDNSEAIDFGSVQLGNGTAQVLKQMNIYGRYAEQDVTVTIVGDDAAMFQVASVIPIASLDYDTPYALDICYRPTAAGQHTAQLVLNAGGDYEPVVFSLTGEATQQSLYYDVNLDGEIGIADVTDLIDLLLTHGILHYTGEVASIGDITDLIDYILNK